MIAFSWSIERWREILELLGTPCALLFTGFALHIDARVRRAETLLEITKQHRELWKYFDEQPELARLLDQGRDLTTQPLTEREARFANFLFLHLRAAYGAQQGKIFPMPEHVGEDWREIFQAPAITAAWERIKHLHDRRFVALVEKYRSAPAPTN
ncbi:MAG: hypothetical protein HZA93_29585 [Verrucomicrobia bacterium]|nr:hypothetical protein [Verrucomicrobiota bacterium]